jgi:hypothetical protein
LILGLEASSVKALLSKRGRYVKLDSRVHSEVAA